MPSKQSESPVFERRKQSPVELREQSGRGLDVAPAVQRDLPHSSAAVVRTDRKTIHSLLLGALDAERLAGEVEIPLPGGAEERQDLQQVRVGTKGIAIADEVLCDWNAEGGAAKHEKGTVETAAVERHEAVKSRDGVPELRQKHGLGIADEGEEAVAGNLLRPSVVLFVPDAAASRFRVEHRENDDASGERPERQVLADLLPLFFGARVPLQVGLLRVVERVPLDAHRLDVENDSRHGAENTAGPYRLARCGNACYPLSDRP